MNQAVLLPLVEMEEAREQRGQYLRVVVEEGHLEPLAMGPEASFV